MVLWPSDSFTWAVPSVRVTAVVTTFPIFPLFPPSSLVSPSVAVTVALTLFVP